jgi:quercetin dioxygenase-like cupin family protein
VDVRLVAVGAGALALGAGLGVAGERIASDDPRAEPALIAEGTLASLPRGRVQVRAETVVLPSGFRSRHRHGGPTFNFVESGSVAIDDEAGRTVHSAGDFFFEPAGRPHTITVVENATLRVVRLLPPGAEATTEIP